jgi:hypothetical protein
LRYRQRFPGRPQLRWLRAVAPARL